MSFKNFRYFHLFLPIAVGDGLAIDAVSVSVVIIGELKSPLSFPSSPSYENNMWYQI